MAVGTAVPMFAGTADPVPPLLVMYALYGLVLNHCLAVEAAAVIEMSEGVVLFGLAAPIVNE